eukprot:TRINITY_DN17362_c0_g1_i1.p1 TRINITY_DN17362_c0_g1~~TRINITY_DN17362_c0_g1_i1.p1  ORF type:complete len:3719 (+),score=933.30 TRINITY_DN17362_c0_g1_i1:1202-11158(+)
MILAMLELMQKTDVPSLPTVAAMLRCLELAAEVSGTAAVVLFRDFSGLQAFSLRLQREVDLLMALDFTGDVYEMEPPSDSASSEQRRQFWQLLEEVTARRRLCRQLLKNIQSALQCAEVVQAGLASVFQGPLMDALKTALQEPSKVGLSLFGTAIDIVSNIIQDDPSRVPQMIESQVLPGIVGALNKDNMRSAECLSFVPGVLGSIALHAVGEDFILNSESKPIKLLVDILVDTSFSSLLHSQPELSQIMSTHVDKVLRNRPSGPNKLTEHVVDCMLDGMRSLIEQAKAYPEWTPADLEDHTEFLADRLAPFSRFCWSILSTNELTLKVFLEKQGLALVRELHELPCLPYHLTSLEGHQHPMASLFNLQARGPDGNLAVAAALKEMLGEHLGKAGAFLRERLTTPGGDPYLELAAAGDESVAGFLQSLSRVSSALEGLLAVCREGSSVQVLEAVREPLKSLVELAPSILFLTAWHPLDLSKLPSTTCYFETVKQVFSPSEGSSSGSGSAPGSPMLEAARLCFRMTSLVMRQLLVVASKQLHSRARQREVSPSISGLAGELAELAKACLAFTPPSEPAAAMRWTGDLFDLLLRMHEEQNRVAVRPLSLCAFYQVGGFDLLGPMLQRVSDHLDLEQGPPALGSALAYLEKVTSHKRFTNAPQVGLLRTEDRFIPKDPLCRSVQAEALRVLLPVWRFGDMSRFPESAAQSLMKVWVHTLDGPRDMPPRPAQPSSGAQPASTATAAGAPPSPAAAAAAAGTGTDTEEVAREALVSALVDMGFSRDQVEQRIALMEPRSGGPPDISSLLMWMEQGPSPPPSDSPPEEPAPAEPDASAPADPGAKKLTPAKTTEEFQAYVADMLQDLLPRILTFGRKVAKAIPVVADAMAFIVAVPIRLWDSPVSDATAKTGSEANAVAVMQACLTVLGEGNLQPPADALACVSQVLASLLHRRQQVMAAFGSAGAEALLTKLHMWSLMSIDFCVVPFARGYRTIVMGSACPVPEGLGGDPLLAPPAWLTPVMVCAHQLLAGVDLIKIRASKEPLSIDVQKKWITGVLNLLYAFPGLEAGLAFASLQVLTRLCSTQTGARAFLDYAPRLVLNAAGTSLKAPAETAGGMLQLMRLARRACFPGMLQMIADLGVMLLEEGPALQQRMETEILGLFTAQVKTLPAKDIISRLNHLFIRGPELFEEALKAVTQQKKDGGAAAASPDQALLLQPIPEAERQQRSKQRSATQSGAPLLMLQTVISEICLNLEVQHGTAFPKIAEAASKPKVEGDAEKEQEQTEKPQLPPAFPLALDANALLFILDALITRVPGISVLTMRAPLAFGAAQAAPGAGGPEHTLLIPSSIPTQRSLLMLMIRHLLPRFAQLADCWHSQVQMLSPAQKAQLGSSAATGPAQRCLTHLATTLCSAARLSGEPRRALAGEVVLASKALADGPKLTESGSGHLAFGTEVAAVSGLVARLLGAAAAADRKEDGSAAEAAAASASSAQQEENSSRPGTSDGSRPATAAEGTPMPPAAAAAKRAKGKKETGFFCSPGETQALRDYMVAILQRIDLDRSDATAVATAVVKCLEFLTRRETKKSSSQGTAPDGSPPILLEEADESDYPTADRSFQEDYGEAAPGDEGQDDEEEEDEEEDDGEEDEDDDMGEDEEDDDEAAMDGLGGGHQATADQIVEDLLDEDYDGEFEEDYGDDGMADGFQEIGDQAQHNLAAILNNAIHVFDGVFDQQGGNAENVTMRVDFSPEMVELGGGGGRGSRRNQRRGGPGGADGMGLALGGGWSEPGDLDVQAEHPLLRREHHQSSHGMHGGMQMQQMTHFHIPPAPGRDGGHLVLPNLARGGAGGMEGMVQWMPAPGAIRQLFGGNLPGGNMGVQFLAGVPGGAGGPQGAPTTSRGGGSSGQAAAAAAESLDAIYGEMAGRLREQLRTAAPPPAPASAEAAAPPEVAAAEEPTAAVASSSPVNADSVGAGSGTGGEAAAEDSRQGGVITPMPAVEAPPADVVDEAAELLARLDAAEEQEEREAEAAAAAMVADDDEDDEDPLDQEEPTPSEEEAADAEATGAEEDPAAALGIAELERLASRLGCTQTAILQAAEIDASVVAELPEDMRGAVVMATVSQVSLDHLRRPARSAPAAATPAAAATAAPTAGFDEIDASVLEALPPEIREEVMAEEARRREQERAAAQRAAAAAAAPAAAPEATAGGAAAGAAPSGEMDNASFIASLDPMLREEVLMTAPEELLSTLPAELVAEAQMIRDRAFMRIASHREAAPAAQAAAQVASQAVRQVAPRPAPRPLARQHQHLQAMEQQLAQGAGGGGRRAFAIHGLSRGGGQQGFASSDELLAQLGLALGGPRGRQVLTLQPPGGGASGSGAPGLTSFDEADRVLLERLADYDEDACQGVEAPLAAAAIPNVCRLLYLRSEVSVTPLTRLFFNLSLHPVTRNCTLGHFLVLLCRQPEAAGSSLSALPPPHLFEGLDRGQLSASNATEIQAVGAQRVLPLLAYLLRRIPQCGEFFAKPLQKEPWLEGDGVLVLGGHMSDLVGQHSVNLLLRLLTTKLFLASSRHAGWLLALLHALLVPQKQEKSKGSSAGASDAASPAAATGAETPVAAEAATPADASDAAGASTPAEDSAAGAGTVAKTPSAEQQSLQRWSKITGDLHNVLSQESVLALCNFLCQAGSGHGSSGEADTFQMAGEILVALAATKEHLDRVRAELIRDLASLVTNIKADLDKCEPTSADPSTMETRLLRLVRTLAEVFKEAAKASPEQELKIEGFLEEASLEDLWVALDTTLDRMHDTEVFATPAQRILATGVAPSQLRVESSSGSSTLAQSGNLASNVQTTPPKPLLNRLLPLIEGFFVLHNGTKEAELDAKEKEEKKKEESEEGYMKGRNVFAELNEVSQVERSRFGLFCKQHRRPLNALIKQTPSLLNKSFSPVLKHLPSCLDFDNKRAYFRSQLRSRRAESRYETIRLRVRRTEIFMDSYHQLRSRSGEEMRAKIQVQFQGEEGIDAGGVGKEWYGALAKEIFNPNYALFVQAGGKACTYHPNPMSYVTRDHLEFFQFIGRVIGKAIHDGQNMEAWFTRGFYKHMLGKKVIAADLEAFDPEYFSNLKWMLDHDITDVVELTFSAESDELGQRKVVDLKPNGRNLPVTNDNKYEYIQLMSEHKMTNAVRQQIDAFLKGLHEIVPAELLSLFDDMELELMISGLPDIDVEDLKANTEYHNYTAQSDQIVWFWKVLSEFSQEQRAWFLQFATGTSRVPVEGFKGLVGMRGPQKFCIHRAYGPERLPSAHTCFNQLDLPDYPSEDVLREKLLQAVREGHEGFGFA